MEKFDSALMPTEPSMNVLRRYNQTVALATSAVLLLSGCEFADSPDEGPRASTTSASPLPLHTKGCLQPTLQELHTARTLLTSPDEPQVTANNNANSAKLLPKGSPILSNSDFRIWQHQIATEQGLKLADSPMGFGSNLSLKESELILNNPLAVLDGLSAFAKNYDLTITIPQSESDLQGLNVAPLNNEIATGGSVVGGNLDSLRDDLQEYPTDIFKYLGIKHIALVRGDRNVKLDNGKTIDIGGQVDFSRHRDTIYVDIYSPRVLDHEIMHTIDYTIGCMTHGDIAYNALNNNVPVYAEETPKDVYSSEGLWQQNYDREKQNKPLLDPANIYTTTDYGFTNILEDKAEAGKYLLDNQFASLCYKGAQRLRAKAALLLARIRKWYPGYGNYLVTTAAHCTPER